MTAKISVRDISVWYRNGKDKKVLDHVSFDVAGGEIVAVIGPSGAGKSTLLQVIGGLLPANGGSVVIDGQQMSRPMPELALMFQEYALFPWRSALGNVLFALEVQHSPRRERYAKARAQLDAVGLLAAAELYPAQMSGGMKQRAALARALVNEPSVLLLDEPFAAVDAITRHILQDAVAEIAHERGLTVLIVTHSIEEALRLGDRIVVLSSSPGHVHAVYALNTGEALPAIRARLWSDLHSDRIGLSGQRPEYRVRPYTGDPAMGGT